MKTSSILKGSLLTLMVAGLLSPAVNAQVKPGQKPSKRDTAKKELPSKPPKKDEKKQSPVPSKPVTSPKPVKKN